MAGLHAAAHPHHTHTSAAVVWPIINYRFNVSILGSCRAASSVQEDRPYENLKGNCYLHGEIPHNTKTVVVVCHTWWGLTEFYKQICYRLANKGFVALAPDLYHGSIANSIGDIKHLRVGLE